MTLLSVTTTLPSSVIKILELLKTPSPLPRTYGVFHCLTLAVSVVLVWLLCRYLRDASDHTMRTIVGIFWATLVIFEIMKEVIICTTISGNQVIWQYRWSIFPFQLCSTPLYVLPLVAFLKDGFVRRTAIAYSATYAFLGGLAVLIVPKSVFSTSLVINMQTMLHHVLQMSVGAYIAVHQRYDIRKRDMIGSIGLFSALLAIAAYLNERMHAYFVANGISDQFNMFFVSPYYAGPIPALDAWRADMEPMLFVLLYAIVLTVVALTLCRALQMAVRCADAKERRALPTRK